MTSSSLEKSAMKFLFTTELSTLKADKITIRAPLHDKIKAIIEMITFDAWLDEFDVFLMIETLFKTLNKEQKANLLTLLGDNE